jgi:SAM-dependent methyltransferase
MPDDPNWMEYYEKISGRPVRELLIEGLALFPEDLPGPLQAIDLGSGDGTESAYLLANGWSVLAVDNEAGGFELLKEKAPPGSLDRLRTQTAAFESVELVPADLVHASYSLPFCPPGHFDAFWAKIVAAIRPGGRFVGQLFGPNDTWADDSNMTFHNRDQVKTLLSGFEFEKLEEIDEDGEAASGPKHWHLFNLIAKRV